MLLWSIGERGQGKGQVMDLKAHRVNGLLTGTPRTESNLWRKVNAYETMLNRLIPRVGDEDRAAIENVLLTVLPFSSSSSSRLQSTD